MTENGCYVVYARASMSSTLSASSQRPTKRRLLDAGSEANARAKGTLRLEGKDYIVQDGDILHIRHSG